MVGLAMIEEFAGYPERSIRLLEPHVDADHALEPVIEILSESYLQAHRGKRAIELLRSMPVAPPDADARAVYLAIAYAETGESAKATENLQQLENKVRAGEPITYPMAKLYTALGNHQKAMEMLQIAFNRRDSGLLFVNVDPPFAPLRGEQQYQTLLQQMNLQ
jgi:tetratricopeptide (TPR) repeat protein